MLQCHALPRIMSAISRVVRHLMLTDSGAPMCLVIMAGPSPTKQCAWPDKIGDHLAKHQVISSQDHFVLYMSKRKVKAPVRFGDYARIRK